MSDNQRGSRPVDNPGGRNFVRQSNTPQRPFNMEAPSNKGPKLVIQRAQKSSISISKNPNPPKNQRQNQPVITSTQSQNTVPHITQNNNFNQHPQQNHNSPQIVASQQKQFVPPPNFQRPNSTFQLPPTSIIGNPGSMPQQMHQAFTMSPQVTAQTSQPNVPSQYSPSQTSAPPPDFFSKLSLLSYVTSAKEDKSFNDTDLNSLGIDMNDKDPMLPKLHSVLSEAPLSNYSVYPTPSSYSSLSTNENPIEKMTLFNDQILFFIFYTQVKTEMQNAAAEELGRRGYTYDEDKSTWSNNEGSEWDVNQWKLIEATISPQDE